jgi:hypothetical protein
MSHYRLATVLLGAATLTVTACTSETASTSEVNAPAVTIAGEPENCIQTSRIAGTRVHDDFTIDFELTGGNVYRNTLPGRCPGLGFEERFGYRVSAGQLCRLDTITVLQSGGATPGPTCALGPFVPVRYVDAD